MSQTRDSSGLKVEGISVAYGRVTAVREASLTVKEGEIVALIGANGAGKTSLLNAIAGIVSPRAGTVEWKGTKLLGLPAHRVVGAGVGYVPEGRQLFGAMRVEDNLLLGSYVDCARKWHRLLVPARSQITATVRERMDRVYSLFPILAERRGQQAGSLSGGEQQMLAIGRALMSAPSILLLDEPSVGLAPQVVKGILSLLVRLGGEGLTILLVEQEAGALKVASRGYVMEQGRIVLEGEARELVGSDKVRQAYLGRSRAA